MYNTRTHTYNNTIHEPAGQRGDYLVHTNTTYSYLNTVFHFFSPYDPMDLPPRKSQYYVLYYYTMEPGKLETGKLVY